MHLDSFSLPSQANGDCNDQLQRVGMIGVGNILNPNNSITILTFFALKHLLQPYKGTYTRFSGSPTNDVTGDQLVPVYAYWVIKRKKLELMQMISTLIKRFGFAQNTRKNGDPTIKTTPDFILFRVLPFITRLSPLLYLFSCVLDILLVLAAISAVVQGSEEDTDDNNTIVTLAVCKAVMPTPLSLLAAKIYIKFRKPPGAAGSLRDYHAASTGGNPEVAELWVPIVEKF